MKEKMLHRLQKISKKDESITPSITSLTKKEKKILFNKFKETLINKLEETAAKDLKSYQIPIDKWDISTNIQDWCKENGLKYWTASRKVGHRKPFQESKIENDEVRLMMISWD